MVRQTEGKNLEDLIPVPKKQPGRHFSAGYHVLGHVTSSYDAKYAQMTYGDHYRKKVEEDIERERSRIEEVMLGQKLQANTKKQAMKGQSPGRKKPRYDLNDVRHHQRRCAALLFCARQKGAHDVPLLVRWAPRRRESYYLMSERVYNDRLLMKLREQEEEERRRMLASPLNFDFLDKLGDTSHLYDFQKLIDKTSMKIKGMSFDTEYNDYDYEFSEGEKKKKEDPHGRASLSPSKGDESGSGVTGHSKQRVTFSDQVSDHESEGRDRGLSQMQRNGGGSILKHKDVRGIDVSDIEVDLSLSPQREVNDSGNSMGEEDEKVKSALSIQGHTGSSSAGSGRFKKSRRRSGFTYDTNGHHTDSTREGLSITDRSLPDEDGDSINKNKYCKHSPTSFKKKAQDYYKKLPRLLRTSELREKATAAKRKEKPPKAKPVGPYVTHECMAPHKTAYERALALVRGRSLPSSHRELFNRTSRMTFSYFHGMPGTEAIALKSNEGKIRRIVTVNEPPPHGRKQIFGDVDMNDFYREDDELIYYIKAEELRTVVETSQSIYSDDDEEDDESSSGAVTRATSETYTLKVQSSLGTDSDSKQ